MAGVAFEWGIVLQDGGVCVGLDALWGGEGREGGMDTGTGEGWSLAVVG